MKLRKPNRKRAMINLYFNAFTECCNDSHNN